MIEEGDDNPKSGSITQVTQRLLLWAQRRAPVLLRVEFVDELARKQVVQNLKDELQNNEIPVHEIELPTDQPDDLGQWLVEKLEKLPPGVASIDGFALALPENDPELQRALYALNLRREVFASFPLCQIWWMPQHIIEQFAGRISDLNSWFRLRASLTQLVPAVPSESSGQILTDMITQTIGLERVAGLSQNERDSRSKELKNLLLEIQATPENQRDIAQESRILSALVEILHIQAQYNEEEPLMLRLLAIDEAAFGSEHTIVASRLNNLALLYKATNQLKEAEPLMKRALKIDEAALGKDHPGVATDLNNLAQLYKDTNRLKEAEPLIKRALKIDEMSLGKDHPNVAIHMDNLAQLYQDTNRLKEAEPLMKRALKIKEAALGKDHLSVAISLNNLAALYQDTNRLKEAVPLMKRALKIDEESLGKDHPNVAIYLSNLALLYKITNHLKEAEPLMQRAVKIFEKSLGENHPNVATALNNLAQLYQDTNRFKEAESLMQRALKIDEASFGKDHPKIARNLNNLAMLYKATNRLKEAEPLMERHLVILLQFTRRTGHPHPNLNAAIDNYSNMLIDMGHSQNEINNRLNRLDPEFFESQDN